MSVVLVTGASRGIGRAIVERFAREGATVIACARGQAALDALRATLPQVESHASDKRDGNEAGATLHVYALSILNSTLVEMQKGRA